MYTDTIEDTLVDTCERMGYGLDLNYLQGKVTITTGVGKRKDRHVFANATSALIWAEVRERQQQVIANG